MHPQKMSRSLTNHLRAANGSSERPRARDFRTRLTVSVPWYCFADGFLESSRQVLNEGLDKHPGGIRGDHDDPLSSLGQPIPFGVGCIEYPILLQGTKIRNRSSIGLC